MWQDGVALLIVVIAALALLRLYLPSRLFGFGARNGASAAKSAPPPAGGCSGCGLGASCAKVRVNRS